MYMYVVPVVINRSTRNLATCTLYVARRARRVSERGVTWQFARRHSSARDCLLRSTACVYSIQPLLVKDTLLVGLAT